MRGGARVRLWCAWARERGGNGYWPASWTVSRRRASGVVSAPSGSANVRRSVVSQFIAVIVVVVVGPRDNQDVMWMRLW